MASCACDLFAPNVIGYAARRWIRLVFVICRAEEDVPTIREWARLAGSSERVLRSRCRRLDVSAKASLDFARMLRLFIRDEIADAANVLASQDERTVRRLLGTARLSIKGSSPPTIWQFLETQQLVTEVRCLDGRRLCFSRSGSGNCAGFWDDF